MELYPATWLKRSTARIAAAERYLGRLPLRPDRRRDLLRRASANRAADSGAVMSEVHRALAGEIGPQQNPAYASVRGRLEIMYGSPLTRAGPLLQSNVRGQVRLATTPALSRRPMAPHTWASRTLPLRRSCASERGEGKTKARARVNWHRAGTWRRSLLLGLSLAQTSVAAWCMTAVLPYHGHQPLEIAILGLFVLLFGWVSAGFWTAMMGFMVLAFGGDRYAISRSADEVAPIARDARTAIVMPIANEDVQRVFAGLRTTYESLCRSPEARHFDFFVLSDSSDPDLRVAETQAWLDMCREVGGFGRVFYRWRQHRIKRKSGNVGDFCRRWGSNYRYMVVLDADSVMSGECLVRLVQLMEANPNAGIIQTAPRSAGRETLFARIQQFASRLYGPLFTAGLHYWQLGESHYWGHNAIIRLEPFMRHCALARLPGKGALSGEILSHDFVEAALMRRAGWGVWIAYDLKGSYEEMPPNLVDELKRDRRWCQGNLINSRLMFSKGLHPAHRAVFMTGVMAYLSAPLWFLFLLLSTVVLAVHTLVPPRYFVQPNQLFPLWPEWHEEWAIALSAATGALLFLPKILSILLVWLKGERGFGSRLRLGLGMLGESLSSALLAPVRMLFHTQFVLASLLGVKVNWKSPPRDDAQTGWVEALHRHGWHTLLGIAWAALVYWLNPSYLWWLAPVVGALVVSIPISVISSRVSMGRRLRRSALFVVPEELRPPAELARLQQAYAEAKPLPGFVQAVVDPVVNAFACASAIPRMRLPAEAQAQRVALVDRALTKGAAALQARECNILLSDALALSKLHFAVWTSGEAHKSWIEAQYASIEAHDKVIPLPAAGAGGRRSARLPGRGFVPPPVHQRQPPVNSPH